MLWGSQTGNAEELAAASVASYRSRIPGPCARSAWSRHVVTDLVGAAGAARGDQHVRRWRAARQRRRPVVRAQGDDVPRAHRPRLRGLAIGDPSYDDFCGHGRGIDTRLGALGGTALLPRVDCEPDYAEPAPRGSSDGRDARPLCAERAWSPPVPLRRSRPDPVAHPVQPGARAAGAQRACSARPGRRRRSASWASTSRGRVCRTRRGIPSASSADQHRRGRRGVARGDGAAGTRSSRSTARSASCRGAPVALDITKITPDLLAFLAERNADPRLATLLRRENKAAFEVPVGHAGDRPVAEFPVEADTGNGSRCSSACSRGSTPSRRAPTRVPTKCSSRSRSCGYDGRDGGPARRRLLDLPRRPRRGGPVPVYVAAAPHFKPPSIRRRR